MADNTQIQWSDATWNPITGCSVVSPGCTNCYAMKLAGGRLKHHPSRKGLTKDSKAGPVWTGEVRFNNKWLDQPLRWKRPRRIFVCAHGDLFHEKVENSWIHKVFAVMALSPQHQFQVLTKRSERMRRYFRRRNRDLQLAWWSNFCGKSEEERRFLYNSPRVLPNVWLGVSVEDQKRADERIPDLLQTPAAVRFISAEPLLGAIDLQLLHYDEVTNINALTGKHGLAYPLRGEIDKLDWVIAGGESGNRTDKFRDCDPDWVRYLRDQCAEHGTPFFFKQWGGRTSKAGGNELDGELYENYPSHSGSQTSA